jgi:hypothetical protein
MLLSLFHHLNLNSLENCFGLLLHPPNRILTNLTARVDFHNLSLVLEGIHHDCVGQTSRKRSPDDDNSVCGCQKLSDCFRVVKDFLIELVEEHDLRSEGPFATRTVQLAFHFQNIQVRLKRFFIECFVFD